MTVTRIHRTAPPGESSPAEVVEVICFARGTLIATPCGAQPIETLAEGDLVLTRDRGAQPIRWIGSQTVRAMGGRAPVVIARGALGNHSELRVSRAHRLLISEWRAELMFGEPEVLVCAGDLVNGETIFLAEGGTVEYFHILLDRHEIVTANGTPAESFHPAEQGIGWMEAKAREAIFAVLPGLRAALDGFGPSARTSLRPYEARALRR